MTKIVSLNGRAVSDEHKECREDVKKRLEHVLSLVDDENLTSIVIVAVGPGLEGGISARSLDGGGHYKMVGVLQKQVNEVLSFTSNHLMFEEDE